MRLFERMATRVEVRAKAAAQRVLDVAETAIAEFPDIMVRREGDALVISGRGLMRRWLGDVRLRFAFWSRG